VVLVTARGFQTCSELGRQNRAAGDPAATVPACTGVLSAYGMLVARIRRDAARSVLLSDADAAALRPVFAELAAAAAEPLLEEGAEPHETRLRQRVDAHYRGQSHELTVAAEDWPCASATPTGGASTTPSPARRWRP
jgi:N-methylhydantoinase A/oxoprolinase/acetone carboxylase beta subunit